MTLERLASLDIHLIASLPATLRRAKFDVKVTAKIEDLTAMSLGGIISIILSILIVSLVITGLVLQLIGKVDFIKRCRPKPPTEMELKQLDEQQVIRDLLEETDVKDITKKE